ncbi:MAG: dehydratase, partial [Proteobacteria bacterium]|nr:dehydratase [Pseudomonadota bacterium]
MATIFNHPSELKESVGKQLGVSEWLEIDQARIDTFA